MNKPLKHHARYWGTKTDYNVLLKQIAEIGPVLVSNADANEEPCSPLQSTKRASMPAALLAVQQRGVLAQRHRAADFPSEDAGHKASRRRSWPTQAVTLPASGLTKFDS